MKFVTRLYFLTTSVLVAHAACNQKSSNSDVESAATPTRRIIGGSNATEGAYPYMAFLKENYGYFICGCSILNERWVLTSAHCVSRSDVTGIALVTGTNDIKSGGDNYVVFDIHLHEDYDPWDIKNDCAVLRVPIITFKYNVQPIALGRAFVGHGVRVKLTGWGVTAPNDYKNPVLQQIDLVTITNEECEKMHGAPINETELCTFTKVGEGATEDDRGGPLVQVSDDGSFIQVGILSWIVPSASGYPDVHTRVSSFVDWIEHKINRNNSKSNY